MQIPLFPLHVVLFPGQRLPLHVFEHRYREMMADVLGTDETTNPDASFGIVCIREGYEVGERAETHDVGCLGVVEWARRHPDGTMDLVVRGARRFRILTRPPDDPYPRADVDLLEEVVGPRATDALALARAALERYAAVAARYAREPSEVELPAEPTAASYGAAAALAVDATALQSLLEARSASERLAAVAALARSEATLLDTIGVPLRRPPIERTSLN